MAKKNGEMMKLEATDLFHEGEGTYKKGDIFEVSVERGKQLLQMEGVPVKAVSDGKKEA